MKKLKDSQRDWLNKIYNLIQEKDINDNERQILVQSKNAIEKGGRFESHMINLRNSLLPLVVIGNMSQEVRKFYKELRVDRKISLDADDSLPVGILNDKKIEL
ncbi:bacteriocin immunity protein [Lactococcus lactis]|uniref:bacteriocin immunity protein n=1 Tax=Lactococcus lactis TaxID=1358 RepID=UPI002026DA73|nr:bacteriocin immunity protein [Lactococcus lactis]MCL9638864.1 bacteriocin immunity protein [Lactococcus lactis]